MMRRASSRIVISSVLAAAAFLPWAPALADPQAPPAPGAPPPPGASAPPVFAPPPAAPPIIPPPAAPPVMPPSAAGPGSASPPPGALVIPYDEKKLPALSPPPEDAMRHRVDASQLPALPPPFSVGGGAGQPGKQPALPPPPAGALIYWPVCGDKPCPPGTAGVWVYYPAPWPYTHAGSSTLAEGQAVQPAESLYPRRSNAALGFGIGMMSVSAPLIVIGQLVHTANDDDAIHATTAVLGAVLGVAGIGLTIYGAPRKKPEPPPPEDWVSRSRVTVNVGAGTIGATWQF